MKEGEKEALLTLEMIEWVGDQYTHIHGGEKSALKSLKPYGGSLILTFENGNKYKLNLQKWTPENLTLGEV